MSSLRGVPSRWSLCPGSCLMSLAAQPGQSGDGQLAQAWAGACRLSLRLSGDTPSVCTGRWLSGKRWRAPRTGLIRSITTRS